MNINLITLATVKTQLDLNKSTYDNQITAMIPVVSNDVRRILNCNYSDYIYTPITNGSATFTWGDVLSKSVLAMGLVVVSAALPDETYLTAYDPITGTYTMSAAATDDADYFNPTIMISQWPTISKMIFYKIGKQSTDSATEEKLSQIRYGNVSKTYGAGEINRKYDYPQSLLDDLGRPFVVVG